MRLFFLIVLVGITVTSAQTAVCQPSSTIGSIKANHSSGETDPLDTNSVGSEADKYYPRQHLRLSPGTAVGLALFPGIVFHGVGHLYAKRPDIGLVLLGADIATALVFIYWTLAEAFSDQPSNLSDDVLWVSGGINIAAWLFDIAHAGFAAKQYNSRLGYSIDSNGGKLTFCLNLQLGS